VNYFKFYFIQEKNTNELGIYEFNSDLFKDRQKVLNFLFSANSKFGHLSAKGVKDKIRIRNRELIFCNQDRYLYCRHILGPNDSESKNLRTMVFQFS